MGHNSVAFCAVEDEQQAYDIVIALEERGFPAEDLSVLLPSRLSKTSLVHEVHSKAPEGASVGAGVGGTVGGILGLLVGLGTLAIPGLGPLVAAGPLLAALSGIAAGGAVGGLSGALVGLGMTEVEARVYEQKLAEGAVIVTADCHDDAASQRIARDVYIEHGAKDISFIRPKAA